MTDEVIQSIRIKLKKLEHWQDDVSRLPYYATGGSAGMDLSACIPEPILIPPWSRAMVRTGLAIELPSPQYVALVFPRSGLASRFGISLANAVGVIDSDYKGEIICSVQNNSPDPFTVNPGDRIAQILFLPVARAVLETVAELAPSERGDGGFGSTGIGKEKRNTGKSRD